MAFDKESVRRSAQGRSDLTLNYYEAGEPDRHRRRPAAADAARRRPRRVRVVQLRRRAAAVRQHASAPCWSTSRASAAPTSRRWSATTSASPLDYVVALLDELGIERVHLLGNSLGGGTATRLAIEHPDRVGRLDPDGPGRALAQPVPRRPHRGRQAAHRVQPRAEPRGAPRVHLDHGGQPGPRHRRAGRGAVRRRDRARRARGDDLDGHVLLQPGHRRGRHALARRPQDPQAHAAHLGPRGPRQPARRRAGRAQGDPARHPACLPQLWALGPDRGRRRVRRGRHGVPRPPRNVREESAHDHRHQVHGLRPRGLAPTPSSGRRSPARCSAWPRAAARTPTTSTGGSTRSRPGSSSSPSDVDQLDCVGWELADHAALQEAREHLEKAGVEVEEGTAEELAERRVQELVRFRDPFDNVFELFHGITYESRPVVTPYAATFVTGDQGMGHIVLPVTDDVEALRFYRDTLGFRLRDSMSMPGEFVGKEPGSKVWLRFLGRQPAAPLAGVPADAEPVEVRAHHARGRRARPRRPRAGAGPQAQGAAVRDAGPAHERRDDLVLRPVARRLRRRVRHRRPHRRRRPLGRAGVDRRLVLGSRLRRAGSSTYRGQREPGSSRRSPTATCRTG